MDPIIALAERHGIHVVEDAKMGAHVATLPPKYRDALTLFYFMEMDLAAAAAALGIPQGTLKARLHRARARLRRQLGTDPRLPAPEAAR